jgi:rhodanese-related sulfurtransferase
MKQFQGFVCLVLVMFLGATWDARAGGDSMTLEEVQKFVDSREGVLLDARGAKFFAKSHIPGAISLPVNNFDKAYEGVEAKLKPDQRIVIYCSSVSCPDSGRLKDKLVKLGYSKVEVFKGGLAAWWKAGLPMEKSEPAK